MRRWIVWHESHHTISVHKFTYISLTDKWHYDCMNQTRYSPFSISSRSHKSTFIFVSNFSQFECMIAGRPQRIKYNIGWFHLKFATLTLRDKYCVCSCFNSDALLCDIFNKIPSENWEYIFSAMNVWFPSIMECNWFSVKNRSGHSLHFIRMLIVLKLLSWNE